MSSIRIFSTGIAYFLTILLQQMRKGKTVGGEDRAELTSTRVLAQSAEVKELCCKCKTKNGKLVDH